MKLFVIVCLFGLSIISCSREQETTSAGLIDWDSRAVNFPLPDSLESGTTYLSIYSQIYSMTEHRTHDLTTTTSIRNTSRADTLFIEKAEYFDTHGSPIRVYVDRPVYLAPMETIEIVIAAKDQEGGTGANFMFDWRIKPGSNEPLFEGIMISTSGQQGLSFSTRGIRVK